MLSLKNGKSSFMFDYHKHTIFLTLAGSRAYGTNYENSDFDYRGILIRPKIYDDGFLYNFEQKEGLDGYSEDTVVYDIKKFFRLAVACNPNIIELLFTPDHLVQISTPFSDHLRENRYLFLSKMAKGSFCGYATGQSRRLENHKAWLDRESKGFAPSKPIRKDYGLPPKPKLPKDQLNSLMCVPSHMLSIFHRSYIKKERKYQKDYNTYSKWKNWKENRNKARAELEAKYGYDLKFAMHLARLLLMCEEILRDGEVIVERPDKDFLLSIRNGEFKYEKFMKWVSSQEAKIKKVYEKSCLPSEPDLEKLNEICAEIVNKFRLEENKME